MCLREPLAIVGEEVMEDSRGKILYIILTVHA